MDASLERQSLTKVEDLGHGQYLLKCEQTMDILKRHLKKFKAHVHPPLNLIAQSQIFILTLTMHLD